MWYPSKKLDNSEMAKLARDYYGATEIAHEEFLIWEYNKNPHGDVIGNLARNTAGEVVSQYLIMPKDVWCNERILKGSHSLNTLTHPDYNGQGIFTSLAKKTFRECSEQGVLFTYATPNPNSDYGFRKKLEFIYVGNLDFFTKPINLSDIIQIKVKSKVLLKMLTWLFNPIKLLFRQKAVLNSKLEVREVFCFSDRYENFWEQYRKAHIVIVDRSSQLMNWRYFQAPLRKYRVFMAYNEEYIVGCIVIRMITLHGIRTGLIVDIMTDDTEGIDGSHQLLRVVEEVFTQENVAIAGCLLKEKTREAKSLQKMGYRACPRWLLPQPFPVYVKIHKEEYPQDLKKIFNWDNWFFTMGDYDVG